MSYKVTIKTVAGDEFVADDLVVKRQGTSAYNAIANRKDVFIKKPTGDITVIPFSNIVDVQVSDSNVSPTPDDRKIIFDETVTTVLQEGDEYYTAALTSITEELEDGVTYYVKFGDMQYEFIASEFEGEVTIGNLLRDGFYIIYYDGSDSPHTYIVTSEEVVDRKLTIETSAGEDEGGDDTKLLYGLKPATITATYELNGEPVIPDGFDTNNIMSYYIDNHNLESLVSFTFCEGEGRIPTESLGTVSSIKIYCIPGQYFNPSGFKISVNNQPYYYIYEPIEVIDGDATIYIEEDEYKHLIINGDCSIKFALAIMD